MTAPGCLDPANCPVPDHATFDLHRLKIAKWPAGETLYTSYKSQHWPKLFNSSGAGNARFSPISDSGTLVPTMYAAESQTVALLETAFHEVHQSSERTISAATDLRPRGMVTLSAPTSLPLVDLTDAGLERNELQRYQLISTTPQHYRCTQAWALRLHGRSVGGVRPVGILWQSRIAELAGKDTLMLHDLLRHGSRVCVLFGDRIDMTPESWLPGDPQYDDLSIGLGRLFAEEVAEVLKATIVEN